MARVSLPDFASCLLRKLIRSIEADVTYEKDGEIKAKQSKDCTDYTDISVEHTYCSLAGESYLAF